MIRGFHGAVGMDRRRRLGHRITVLRCRPRHCLTRARSRDLAPLPEGCGALMSPRSTDVKEDPMGIALTLQQYLSDQHIDYEVMTHQLTATSSETAQASHVPASRVAKGVVLTREG